MFVCMFVQCNECDLCACPFMRVLKREGERANRQNLKNDIS